VTSRDRHALRLGALLVAGALLSLRAGPWLHRTLTATRARLIEQHHLLSETQRLVAELPILEDSAGRLAGLVAGLAPRLLAGYESGTALGDLAGRLSTVAGRHRAEVLSVDALPDSTTVGQLGRLTARARLATDFRGAVDIVAALGRGTVVLVPEAIRLVAQDPAAGPEASERLEVELLLSGWYLPGESLP